MRNALGWLGMLVLAICLMTLGARGRIGSGLAAFLAPMDLGPAQQQGG